MEMIYSVLTFLDAFPLAIFIGTPDNGTDWSHFFEDIFASFIAYLVTDDERIRHLTAVVARKIMAEGTLSLWHTNKSLEAETLKNNFWKST
jgi:neurofibromin 1